LDLYIFIFGGVSFVYICRLVVDWVTLCFWGGSVLACVHVCRFSVLCDFVFFVFVCFWGCCDSSAPNEDIMRFRYRVGVIYPFVHIFVKFFYFCIVFLLAFEGLLCNCDRFLISDSLVASSYIVE